MNYLKGRWPKFCWVKAVMNGLLVCPITILRNNKQQTAKSKYESPPNLPLISKCSDHFHLYLPRYRPRKRAWSLARDVCFCVDSFICLQDLDIDLPHAPLPRYATSNIAAIIETKYYLGMHCHFWMALVPIRGWQGQSRIQAI